MLFIGEDSVQNILAAFPVCSQNTFIYQKLYTRLRQRIKSRPVRAHIESLILDSLAGISLNALPLFSKQQLIDQIRVNRLQRAYLIPLLPGQGLVRSERHYLPLQFTCLRPSVRILYTLNNLLFLQMLNLLILPGLDCFIVSDLRSECMVPCMIFLVLLRESLVLIPQVVVGDSLK